MKLGFPYLVRRLLRILKPRFLLGPLISLLGLGIIGLVHIVVALAVIGVLRFFQKN